MRFCCLGSGSEGNSLVVETDFVTKTKILVDCGLKFDVLEERLSDQEVSASDLDGIFITHEHSDHIRSCLLYTSPSPRDGLLSRMPSSA